MNIENFLQSDFFDSNDLSNQFQFTAFEACHQADLNTLPVLINSFKCEDSTSNSIKEGIFALHNRILVHYESENSDLPKAVLDLSNSRVKVLVPCEEDMRCGFMLARNGKCLKFYCDDQETVEKWGDKLKSVCISTSFNENYKTLETIGKGSFAKVHLIESKIDGKQYAAKVFTKELARSSRKDFQKAAVLNEINVLRELNHENVLKLHEVYETSRAVYLVVELVRGKSLQNLLEEPTFSTNFPEDKVIGVIRSILEALSFLASKGIMHRDLKPEHVLIEEDTGKIKIIDFGLATKIDVSDYLFKKCGSPGYIAPEVFNYNKDVEDTFYNDRCDVFSAGCILFFMLFGKALFDGNGISTVLELNKDSGHLVASYDNIREQIKDSENKINKQGLELLRLLLESDKNKRISASEALNQSYVNPTTINIVAPPTPSVEMIKEERPVAPLRARHTERKRLFVQNPVTMIPLNLKNASKGSVSDDCDSGSTTTSDSPILSQINDPCFVESQQS